MTKKSAIIIGAGCGGLGAACLLAKAGWKVTVFEKNEQIGGRAGVFNAQGFRFDMGPSWYLMPEVFDHFFKALDEKREDYFKLYRLDPSFRVFYKDSGRRLDIRSDPTRDARTFEKLEPGAGKQLKRYLDQAAISYVLAVTELLYKDFSSVKTMLTPSLLSSVKKLNMLSNMHLHVMKYFTTPELQHVLEYPAVFLGASPYSAPAFYSLLNHALFTQGVFYPKGGVHKVMSGLEKIARKHSVEFMLNAPVERIVVEHGQAVGVEVGTQRHSADVVISNADPHHTETQLLKPAESDHSAAYWQKRTWAPSALLMYLGVSRQYVELQHHNLVFSKDWQKNFEQIFNKPLFPNDPSFYVCAPSKTDPTVAPNGKENLFVLVPLPVGLRYTTKQLDAFADRILINMEQHLKLQNFRKHIEYKRLFCVKDFESRFNSFRGTGLGLAHTLKQTGPGRFNHKTKKVKNLYYVGANTHPGIGLPATLISAQLIAKKLLSSA